MLRSPLFAVLFLLAAGPRAHAGDLEGTVELAPPPVNAQPAFEALPRVEEPLDEEEPRPAPKVVPLPKPDPRFGTDEHPRFRRWLTALCRADVASQDLATRVRYVPGKPRVFAEPGNKLGSLLLLLESYAELARFRDDCEASRKKDPEACVHHGRVPRPWLEKQGKAGWLRFGSSAFWAAVLQNRAPAGITPRTDLLAAAKEQVKAIAESLRKNFFEVRDIADLKGRAGTAGAASHLAELVRQESTCGTRAVVARTEKTGREPAQK
jgi:hypothetical protein